MAQILETSLTPGAAYQSVELASRTFLGFKTLKILNPSTEDLRVRVDGVDEFTVLAGSAETKVKPSRGWLGTFEVQTISGAATASPVIFQLY